MDRPRAPPDGTFSVFQIPQSPGEIDAGLARLLESGAVLCVTQQGRIGGEFYAGVDPDEVDEVIELV